MSRIRIKNFGPIREGNNGWIEIKKVTVFIGDQGSGKSTVAKTVSTLSWLEKSMNRGDIKQGEISNGHFRKFFEYQKIHNYFSKYTEIEYFGEKFHIHYHDSKHPPEIKEVMDGNYFVPKIMYIPAERNFLSTISDAYNIKGLPESVFSFAEELKRAQKELSGQKLKLPISDINYEYDENKDDSFVIGKDYKINLLEASSGLQSFIPLYLVSRNLSKAISNDEKSMRKNLSVTQSLRMDKEIADLMLEKNNGSIDWDLEIEKIRARYYNKCFFNVLEEPEQNLFPTSQWEMLLSILAFNNNNEGNKLIITTHSPYIINYLSLCVKADSIFKLLKEKKYKLKDPETLKTNDLVPISSTLNISDLVIYEMNKNDGSIKKLNNLYGIPSDENYLNQQLAESNHKFDALLEIEEEL
ncbi:MAG: ATP-binding protein [Cryomorphaceae bacterium]|nr:ATP-binding protein [Cryomorphaceae bacterium]